MSYRIESEVSYAAYGYYESRAEPISEIRFNRFVKKNFEKRNASAVWFMSNSPSKSLIQYATDLGLHIDVR